MILILLAVLAAPICASVAGLIVGALHSDEALHDSDLVRNFLVVMSIAMIAVWGTSRTHTVRVHIDPAYRIETEIDANPTYTAINNVNPQLGKSLHEILVGYMWNDDMTVSDALIEARPLLTASVQERLGWADQATHMQWARFVVDSLKELQAQDSSLCYDAMAGKSMDPWLFSAENTSAFRQVAVQVLESADKGMRRTRPSTEKHVEFNAAALEFRVVQQEIEQRFGPAVAEQIARRKFSDPPVDSSAQLCRARIAQLEAMLKRPQPMAARLLDSVLR